MHKRFYLLLIVIFLGSFGQGSFAQSATRLQLVESMKIECSKLLGNESSACSLQLKTPIDQTFEEAEIYLALRLQSMVLSDSSDYRERLLEELKAMESNQTSQYSRLLNQCFLTAVIDPRKSDTLFDKIVRLIYNIDNESPINREDSESYLFFKIWLYQLLDARFSDETSSFFNYQYALQIDYFESIEVPFQSISKERVLIQKLEELMGKADEDQRNPEKQNTFLVHVYEVRAVKIMDHFSSYMGDSCFDFVTSLYQKALLLDPSNYRINYNFFLHYYNSGVAIVNTLDYAALSDAEITAKQDQVAAYFRRAEELIVIADRLKK